MYKAIFTYHKFHGDPSQLRFHFNKASDVSSCSHQIFCHGTSCILYKGYKFVNIKNAYNLIFFAHFFNISFEFFSLSLHGSKTNWQRYKKQDDTYEISLSNSRIDLFINLWFSRTISFSGFWEKTFPILIRCLKFMYWLLMCRCVLINPLGVIYRKYTVALFCLTRWTRSLRKVARKYNFTIQTSSNAFAWECHWPFYLCVTFCLSTNDCQLD